MSPVIPDHKEINRNGAVEREHVPDDDNMAGFMGNCYLGECGGAG